MRHALLIFTTTGLALTAALVSCTIVKESDDDGGFSGQVNVNTGGGVSVSGGTTGAGGNNGAQGGTNSTSTGGSASKPEECNIDLPKECGSSAETADLRTVNMLLVIDKSGSMVDQPSGFTSTKWAALGQALDASLSKVAGDMNLGLLLYPFEANNSSVECQVGSSEAAVNVAIGAGSTTVPKIVSAIKQNQPGGGTPTAAALSAAYDYFVSGPGAALAGDKYVMLATDGGPNCNSLNTCAADESRCTVNLDGLCHAGNCCKDDGRKCLDDTEVVSKLRLLAGKGISTFVVGIPGTEQYASYLDQFAEAGGRISPDAPPKYYAVSADGGVEGLTDVFSTITTQLVKKCDIQLRESPPDPKLVNVAIDCQLVKQDTGDGGWSIDTSTEPNTLKLTGDICTNIQTNGAKRVDVYFGCAPIR